MYMQKPVLTSYVVRSVLRLTWVYIVVFLTGLFLGFSASSSVTFVIGTMLLYGVRMWRVWKREEFVEDGRVLTWRRGTFFSRSSTEISLDSVTVVTKSSTYFQRVVFNTCTVTLDSAGTQGTSIVLRDIPLDLEGYPYVQRLLDVEDAIFETRPEVRGIIINGIERLINFAFTLFLLGTGILVVYSEAAEVFLDVVQSSTFLLIITAFLGSFLVLRSLFPTIDLLARQYVVTTSHIVLRGGFFKKVEQVLRKDAVTDSSSRQTFLERLVHVSTVLVSCRGTRSEILYKYLGEPTPFLNTLKNRVEDVDTSVKDEESEQDRDVVFTPFRLRVMIPILGVVGIVLLFPFLFLIIAPFFVSLIKPLRTTYTVRESGGISEEYSFFNTSKRVFSHKDITGVRKRETLIDTLFGTYSVDVWSVGADGPITLQYMHEETVWSRVKDLYHVENPKTVIKGEKDAGAVLQRFIPYLTLFGVVLGFFSVRPVTILGGLFLLGFIGYEWYVSDKRKLVFTDSFVTFEQDGPIKISSIIPRSAVQSVSLRKYPFTHGSVTLYIPGFTRFAPNASLFSLFHPASLSYVTSSCMEDVPMYSPGSVLTSSSVSLWSEALRFLLPGVILGGISVFSGVGIGVSIGIVMGVVCLRVILSSVIETVVSDNGVYVSKGILFRKRVFIPFRTIDHTSEKRSWYEIITGTYTLAVWTMNDGGGNIIVNSVIDKNIVTTIKERLYKQND